VTFQSVVSFYLLAVAIPTRRDAKTAVGTLGVPEYKFHFMDCSDGAFGQLNAVNREVLVRKLSGLILQYEFRQVFVTHERDGHGDHEAPLT
jgi:LmbE family N-acetylglucosaminyl deacetylase